MTSEQSTSLSVRPMAVAGFFYPDRDLALHQMVSGFLASAQSVVPANQHTTPPKAIIVPHAGYIYSGQAAAEAFHAIQPWASRYSRVVLLGPSHRVAFNGVAVPSCDAFETPLGNVLLDTQAIATLAKMPGVISSDRAHAQEHSLEVQLPFLQKTLNAFQLLPIVVGNASPETVRQLLQTVWGGDETLIVISSDLSHYHDYATARQLDGHTCQAIERLDEGAIGHDDACGCIGVRALLLMAKTLGLRARTVSLCNSGDTAGDRARVVGYGSWVFNNAKA